MSFVRLISYGNMCQGIIFCFSLLCCRSRITRQPNMKINLESCTIIVYINNSYIVTASLFLLQIEFRLNSKFYSIFSVVTILLSDMNQLLNLWKFFNFILNFEIFIFLISSCSFSFFFNLRMFCLILLKMEPVDEHKN